MYRFDGCWKPNFITLAGSELVRIWFEPDSVMEFGFILVCKRPARPNAVWVYTPSQFNRSDFEV